MTPSQFVPPDQITVKPAGDGRLAVTVLLSAELVRDYCRFLETLSSFFASVDRKATLERANVRAVANAALLAESNDTRAKYRARLVSSFDAYIGRGLDRKEAVKRVAADLRAESHPWCSPDLVRSELVAAGRGGRGGRPRQVRS